MIDIHSHILPGLDDGSPDLGVSVAMVGLAAEAGTTDIVASPHSDLQFAFDPAVVEGKISELVEATGGVVRIHYGCDFHVHYENVQDALTSPAKYAINHKNYLLVELSELLNVKTADDIMGRLLGAGLVPIITHPERNGVLQKQVERLERWVLDGCCLQVTGQSLLGGFGRKARAFSHELLKRGLVHFVASDGHDCKHRPPRLDDAFDWVRGEHSAALAEQLFTLNPAAVLEGQPLPEVSDEPPTKTKKRWWRR
jgi:protein-tyrosine phosphatase